MTVVIRALLAIRVSGHGVTQTGRICGNRQMPLLIGEHLSTSKKVKAHATDEAVASKELQNGDWQADRPADIGAQACQLTEAET
eukprot:8490349-Karenia_brevis.AAC.1